MPLEQFTEQAYAGRSIKVDREAGMIRGVKLIGLKSANGREYPLGTLEKSRPMYEGRAINIDHNRTSPERKLEDRFGKAVNVVPTSEGLFGDIQCLKTHRHYETVMEMAESMPDLIGLSHSAEGKVKTEKGKSIVEEIVKVKSIDLVTDPATTKGLFESELPETITIAQLAERLEQDDPDNAAVKALVEMVGQTAPLYSGIGMEPTPEAKTEEQVNNAFLAMVVATFKDPNLGSSEKLKKFKTILDAQEKLMGTEAKPDPAAPATPPTAPAAKPVPESVDPPATPPADDVAALKEKVRLFEARDDARKLLADAKLEAPEPLVESLAMLPTTEARKKLIEALPKSGAPNPPPRSQTRTTPIDESKKAPVDLADDAKVAAYLRGR